MKYICEWRSMKKKSGGFEMARMYRVLGFFALIIGLMAAAGHMIEMSLLFLFQAAVFFVLGYMNLTERAYILLFWGYMFISFIGFTYWSVFRLDV